MMKKNGFTLAEVLITLSIIGVVAALTLPSLNMGVQASKVGPSLRKFINTMSNANEMILSENQSNTLRSVYTDQQVADYMTALSGQIRGTGTNNTFNNVYTGTQAATNYGPNGGAITVDRGDITQYSIFNFDGGETIAIRLRRSANAAAGSEQQRDDANGAHRGVFADVILDIDGVNSGANKLGTDLFVFRIDNNGSVIPAGGSAEQSAGYANNIQWNQAGDGRCNVGNNGVGTGINCAGSVADNNWRVIYQY